MDKDGVCRIVSINVAILSYFSYMFALLPQFLDINDRKRMEQRNQRLIKRVEASDEILYLALAHTTACAFYYYPKTRICTVPARTCERYHCLVHYADMPNGFGLEQVDEPFRPGRLLQMMGERIAEDNEFNREIAQALLELNGFTVTCTSNGKEVLEQFRASEPGLFDAILMDIRMPVMDGLEATRRNRTSGHPDACRIPIIALTANVFGEDTKKSIASGMNMAGRIVEAYQKKEIGYEFESPMPVNGGGTAWIHITGRFTDEVVDGIPVIYAIYTDVTEQKKLQLELEQRTEELREALRAAEQANRAKSDFLSRMSHDIRTPMNAIVGMTQIASNHLDDRDKVSDCLRKIGLSSKHLLGLINDVLDMSKIESGKMTLNQEPVFLPEVLDNIVAIIQPSVKERQQHFSVRLHGVKHECFLSDALRLRQVFINILSNAVKFTPAEGSVTMEVWNTNRAIREPPGSNLNLPILASA